MGQTYRIRNWFVKRSGIKIPKSLPMGEWDAWYANEKKVNPKAYFWGVTVPDAIEDAIAPIEHRYDDMRRWLRYRLFDRYHIIKTGLKPGYYDCDTRMLHANMNILKDYVEVELAWRNVVFDVEKKKNYKYPRFSLGWLRLKNFRCPQAGLDYLDWETTLTYGQGDGIPEDHELYGKPTDQAIKAAEVKELYNWWVNVYPNRPDPYDLSGWNEYCDTLAELDGKSILHKLEQPRPKKYKNTHSKLVKIEKDYFKEEQAMLIRLIKIRQSLWS